MPIKFRCPHCKQFLGISQSKAGALTDCPMCGRTVRVPGLDGRIEPLPPPELDHGDRGLAQALDALAALEGGPAVIAEIETPPQKAAPVVVQLHTLPTVEAVPIEIPVPEVPPPAIPSADPMKDLASLQAGPVSGQSAAAGPRGIWKRPELIATAGMTLVLGALIGRWTAPASVASRQAPTTQPIPAVGGSEKAAAVEGPVLPPNSDPAVNITAEPASLNGQITYSTSEGASRPDVGARVLVLPLKHPQVARIAAGSFQSGASTLDLKLAQAAIRALGGDFVLADATGRYSIQVTAGGRYQVYIFSRYQPRPEKQSTEELVSALQLWFDQPQLMLGQTQCLRKEIGLEVKSSLTQDHSFSHPDL